MSWLAELLGFDVEEPKKPTQRKRRRKKPPSNRQRQPLSPSLRRKILARDDYTCSYCGWSSDAGRASRELDVDHRTPVAKGGKNTLKNLVTACNNCNNQKGAKTEAEYLRWRRKHPKKVSIGPHQRGRNDPLVSADQWARTDLVKATRKRLGL